jgi:CO/xanthine dehydrogenase FAD-binding subunit
MRPAAFDYLAPTSLGEALDMLSTDEDAKILAGGQSLITLMKLRLTAPASLIDINRIPGLNYIREEAGRIVIGALTRHDQLASEPLIRRKCILLSEAANVIADQQVRNRGSIGGSLAHADPSADLPTACTALDAELKATSKNGTRTIAAQDFFQDFFTTALSQREILEEIRLPVPPPESGGAYAKLTKGHNDFALVAVGAQCSLNPEGDCESISVVLGGVASTPRHATETEQSLLHKRIDDRLIHEAAMKADSGLDPTPDPRASSEMKRTMIRTMGERTLRTAFVRAREAI